jgi:hypothetical protein
MRQFDDTVPKQLMRNEYNQLKKMTGLLWCVFFLGHGRRTLAVLMNKTTTFRRQ